jgi:Rieske Fe-S protein
MTGEVTDNQESCGGCPLDRREFIRAGAHLAAAAAAIAAIGGHAGAMPVRLVSALALLGRDVTYPTPGADGVSIDHDKDIILARVGTAVYAFDLSCPHQNTALRWQSSDRRFECPKHHSRYTPDGVFIEGRATRSMDRHAVRRDGSNIVVDLDTIYEEDHDGPQWKAAFVTL